MILYCYRENIGKKRREVIYMKNLYGRKFLCIISSILLCFSTTVSVNAAKCTHTYTVRTKTGTEVKCLGTATYYAVNCGNCGIKLGAQTDVDTTVKLGHNGGKEYWLGCNGSTMLFEKRCSRSFLDGICNVILISYMQPCKGVHPWSLN